MVGFGYRLESMQSEDFTCVPFQNCGNQPQFRTSKKATDGALAMSAEKYDTLLFVEHGLYFPALEPKHQRYDRMCAINKETLTRLSYNTKDDKETKWNQYESTSITLNTDIRTIMTKDLAC